MPRRSKTSDEGDTPVVRRMSARIAAVQAASPVKAPQKSPRQKRQSNESAKSASEDTESQQSQIKSEGSIEDVNGVESVPAKEVEAVSEPCEIPPKRQKTDHKTPVDSNNVSSKPAIEKMETSADDFEVIDKDSVPAADSDEVKSAVKAQGEDAHLLTDFVQVCKDDVPTPEQCAVEQSSTKAIDPESKTEVVEHVTSNQISEPEEVKDQRQPSPSREIESEPLPEVSESVPPAPVVEPEIIEDVHPVQITEHGPVSNGKHAEPVHESNSVQIQPEMTEAASEKESMPVVPKTISEDEPVAEPATHATGDNSAISETPLPVSVPE